MNLKFEVHYILMVHFYKANFFHYKDHNEHKLLYHSHRVKITTLYLQAVRASSIFDEILPYPQVHLQESCAYREV